MNGSSETATLPPTTPIQSNSVLFSPYYHHGHNHHFPSNNHYHFYPNSNESYTGESLITSTNGTSTDDIHVTVLKIDQNYQSQQQTQKPFPYPHGNNNYHNGEIMNSPSNHLDSKSDFVTVLKIVSTGATILTPSTNTTTTSHATMNGLHNNQRVFVNNKRGEIEEEVTIYRLPGERLGMALRFDGGQSASETIRRVFVQSITLNSPSSKAIGLMLGMLREGDEILQIDGRASSSLTRLECITLLRDAPVCIRLFVRRCSSVSLTLPPGSTNQVGQMAQNCQTCPSLKQTVVVPKVSKCCQMPLHLPNNSHENINNHIETQNHHCLTSTSTLSPSSSSSLISSTNTPLLTQLLNSCSEAIPKKVPPPVPPRMASTTLSSKRKSRPMPMIPDTNTNEVAKQQNTNNMEPMIIINNQNQSSEPLAAVIQQNVGIEQQHSVEKPPRRKYLHQNTNHNGNPPPLPPRRPKGPPPKPPIDRIQSTWVVNVVNLVNGISSQSSSNNLITAPIVTTKSLPSLVTVIQSSSKVSTDVTDNIDESKQQSCKIDSSICTTTTTSSYVSQSCPAICTTAPLTTTRTTTLLSNSSSNIHHSSKTTAKVTFNISNSKVSSFIRQTAEKLHRKLSGKTTSTNGESDEEIMMSTNSSKVATILIDAPSNDDNNNNHHRHHNKNNEEETRTLKNQNNVILLNNSDEKVNSSASPVLPTPSSLNQSPLMPLLAPPTPANYSDFSQDIEESFESDTDDTSSSVSTIIERGSYSSNPLVSQLEQNFRNQPIISDEKSFDDNISIVDRVFSPFEKLENEFDKKQDISCSSSLMHTVTSKASLDSLETNLLQSSSASTSTLEISKEKPEQLSSDKTIQELINGDVQLKAENKQIIQVEELLPVVESPDSIRNDTDIRRDQPNAINDERTDFSTTYVIQPYPNNIDSNKEIKSTDQNEVVINSDDEDLDAIKNDILSRLDDDKDDFMIDTDYLNETSSRFMYHHNSSELILNSYSELSSITEEDEEEDNSVFETKGLDSIIEHIQTIIEEKQKVENNETTKVIELTDPNKLDSSINNFTTINGDNLEEDKKESKGIYLRENNNSSQMVNQSSTDPIQPKVSLDNVFEFLNKAADDFEFVERMLELTNDKIDSIDDIMRIRESLRGLQESEQRENLQRFLDGKDVFEELIALSSPSSSSVSSSSSVFSLSSSSHSSASSPDNEYPISNEKQSNGLETSVDSRNQTNSPDKFTSLPVCLSDKPPAIETGSNQPKLQQPAVNKTIAKSDQPIESKIPTLLPIKVVVSTGNLNKRSQSISNIFTRSNGISSLIETKPSLIPRPISNFNLSLPSSNMSNLKNVSQTYQQKKTHRTSHNCLNRSTSMQSIFSTNSLSRPTKPNKAATPRRQSSLTSNGSSSNGLKNYHHNCLNNNHDSSSSLHYGSLSRSVSKSSNNVYNTGSLPRQSKTTSSINTKMFSMTNSTHYDQSNENESNHQDFRTTSLTDLTYGLGSSSKDRKLLSSSSSLHFNTSNNIGKIFKSNQSYQQHQHDNNIGKQYSISNVNLFRSDSLSSTIDNSTNSFVRQQIPNNNTNKDHHHHNIDVLEYSNSGFSTLGNTKKILPKQQQQYLRTSSLLTSLLPPLSPGAISQCSNNNNNSHFWHCSNHTSCHNLTSKKTTGNNNQSSSFKVRPITTTTITNQSNSLGKIAKNSTRKIDPKLNCSSNSLPNKSHFEDTSINTTQQLPQSILRTSSNLNKSNNHVVQKKQQNENKNYWSQKKVKSQDFELNSSHSDSESSDITISSGDSSDYLSSKTLKEIWPETKRQQQQQNNNNHHHRVCFMDQIVEHGLNTTSANEQSTINGDLPNVQTEQKLTKMDEHPYSSSPEVAVLSSSTSTSSISSLGSAGDISKLSKSLSFGEHKSSNGDNGVTKSFYLNNNPHREDSGIFASDDTSTSEFSQSPSPELIGRNTIDKIQEEQSESTQSIKKRIGFFNVESNVEQCDSNKQSMALENNINNDNGSNQLSLSRSSSAPCETVCEIVLQKSASIDEQRDQNVLFTSPRFPPEPVVNNNNKNIINTKEPNLFLSRDSFITARRHQNVCKLKGLIIPEIMDKYEGNLVLTDENNRLGLDLPTIISEDILKIENIEKSNTKSGVNENQELNLNKSSNENVPPIEIIPLKPANVNVPKYSPMFKRRTFSLPTNTYMKPVAVEKPINEQIKGPIMPPKSALGKISKPKINIPHILPQKSKENNLNITNQKSNETNFVPSEQNETKIIHETMNKQDEQQKQKIINEVVIYQKQHSMRAIIFHLNDLNLNDEKEYLSHLGMTIKGGFDSDTDNVTVEDIDSNGLAAQDGRLQKGDRIISINGKRLAGMTHNKILDLLKTSCLSQKVVLVCTRPHDKNDSNEDSNGNVQFLSNPIQLVENSNINEQKFTSSFIQSSTDANNNNFKIIRADITKDVTGLGFIIEGGKNSSFGDRPISIKRIFRGGPVDKEGTLVEGDELLFVNDHPVEEMTRAEAWNFLKQLPDGKVSLVVRRRYI